MEGRLPPQNKEAEQTILGCALIDSDIAFDLIAMLDSNDFYIPKHIEIYEAIKDLVVNDNVIDIVTVAEKLKARKTHDKIGGTEYLADISFSVPTVENFKHYASIVKEKSVRRQVIKASADIANNAYDEYFENPIDLQNLAMGKLDIIKTDKKAEDGKIRNIMANVIDSIEKDYITKDDGKLFTGFGDLDKILAGFHKQELTIIAARPGVGKTAIAIQLMLNLAKKGNKCLFVSREMSTVQIGKRILSNIASINGQKLRFCKSLKDQDFVSIAQAAGEISIMPIEINDTLSTIQEIRAYVQKLRSKDLVDIVFIDYLGLLKTMKKCDSRRLEIDDISRHCKEISLELDIPVVVLSQLNRANEKDNREPKLMDLRESGSVEQDSDNVIFLHVPANTDQTQDSFDVKVIVAKQRNGPTGYIMLKYFRQTFKFFGVKGD